jgi:hypothetical protein
MALLDNGLESEGAELVFNVSSAVASVVASGGADEKDIDLLFTVYRDEFSNQRIRVMRGNSSKERELAVSAFLDMSRWHLLFAINKSYRFYNTVRFGVLGKLYLDFLYSPWCNYTICVEMSDCSKCPLVSTGRFGPTCRLPEDRIYGRCRRFKQDLYATRVKVKPKLQDRLFEELQTQVFSEESDAMLILRMANSNNLSCLGGLQ